MLGLTSVSISRVMLSIHSLAAKTNTDPEWLLNNVELSRVKWKRGAHDCELLVDVDVVEDDFELSTPGQSRPHSYAGINVSVKTTRIGVVDDSGEPPFQPKTRYGY